MKKVISRENLPTRLPLQFTALCWLLLDRIESPGWVQGAAWTIVAIVWIGSIISIRREHDVDIFGSRK